MESLNFFHNLKTYEFSFYHEQTEHIHNHHSAEMQMEVRQMP